MATSSEWRVLAFNLMASFQKNHEQVIDLISRTAPPSAPLPSLDRVLDAHSRALALWAESRLLGKTSFDAMKITEDKVASLLLSALPEGAPPQQKSEPLEETPSRPRSLRAPARSRSRGRPADVRFGIAKQTEDGKTICRSWNMRNCNSSSCPDKHLCNWRNAKGRACAVPHRRCYAHNPIFDKARDSRIICSSYNAGNCSLSDCGNLHICNLRTPADEACARHHRRCDAH